MAKKKANKVNVNKVADTSEVDIMLENAGAIADEGILLQPDLVDNNDFFETLSTGPLSHAMMTRSNLQEEIVDVWMREKDSVPRSEWKYIIFNVPTLNPITPKITQMAINEKVKKDKNNFAMVQADIIESVKNSVWNMNHIMKVPPGVAKIYCSLKYDMGFQGFGDTSRLSIPGYKHERIFVSVATELTEEDAIRRSQDAAIKLAKVA